MEEYQIPGPSVVSVPIPRSEISDLEHNNNIELEELKSVESIKLSNQKSEQTELQNNNKENIYEQISDNDDETSIQNKTTNIAYSDISEILTSWDLFELLPRFQEHLITVSTLKSITRTDIEKLLPEIGYKTQFLEHLINWRISKGFPIISVLEKCPGCDVCPSIYQHETSNQLTDPNDEKNDNIESNTDLNDICISSILNTTDNGKAACRQYSISKVFSTYSRKNVLDILLNHFIQKNITLTVKHIECISNKICKEFPNEELASYFIKSVDGSHPRGALYNRYQSKKRILKSNNIWPNPIPNKKQKIDTQPGSSYMFTEEEKNDRLWLFYNTQPWPTIEEKWKISHTLRRKDILNPNGTNLELFSQWPRYKHSLGYRLIDIDYSLFYPGTEFNLLSIWEDLIKKLHLVTNGTKNKDIADIISKLEFESETISTDERNLLIIKVIHYLLPPNYIVSQKIPNAQNIKYKPTTLDSIYGVIIEITNATDLKEKINRITDEKLKKQTTLQPLLIVVLKDSIPSEFFVYVEKTTYKFTDFITAFDILFKSHHSLNLMYTKESYNFWYFVQTFIYKINTKYDKPVSSVANLITQLKFLK